jgi:hypothetical protein
MTDSEIDRLEATLPLVLVAAAAFLVARDEALAAGLSVLEAVDGVIYEVFPDGHRVIVKRIAPPVYVGGRTFLIPSSPDQTQSEGPA